MTLDKNSVKGRIVNAAWELFKEKGYDDTTVDDIIRLSETSKGSFYYHFDSKEAMLDTLSTMLDEQYEKLENEIEESMNSYEKLLFINYKIHTFMEEKINIDLLASLYSTQLTSRGERNLLNQNRKYYQLVSSIIEEGQRRGQIIRE
ncbi:TetR/AcrR family transcriptional regulator, partial [Lachnospiraceae bacterium OttesenSCG-928-E19]|nr:TetR/AcrR family transcriptional regulator [Lachnospiraceae bacterium OttesenSCG-928-E19]